MKTVLILGANSDVAKEAILLYVQRNYQVIAASRDLDSLRNFVHQHALDQEKISLIYFDAVAFDTHEDFYWNLPSKPNIVVYAAGFLSQNSEALYNFQKAYQMMKVNYIGAVSILNIIAMDTNNTGLERIIGLSSLSGVRGRKSNFVYGSAKSAFTQYLAGLRQELSPRNIQVNALVIGYIDTKINQGLDLNSSLMMKPSYVAQFIVNPTNALIIVPNWKWKIIYWILKFLPEFLVAKLP